MVWAGHAAAAGGDYDLSVARLAETRSAAASDYTGAQAEPARTAILSKARSAVVATMAEGILPAWLGTPWSFNGVSRQPGRGSIACGSFVVVTLQHAGFRVPTRMLRQPSENIIRNLVPPGDIRRYSNGAPVSRVVRDIEAMGEGLYLVGLDLHAGFILNRGGKITFWHSTYFPPYKEVIAQDINDYSPFTESQYRVIGKLFSDRMMRKWLRGERFRMTYDYFRSVNN